MPSMKMKCDDYENNDHDHLKKDRYKNYMINRFENWTKLEKKL